MPIKSALKATERSLLMASLRATHRVGAAVSPERTARAIARRFFRTSRPPLERRQFDGVQPQERRLAVQDGEVAVYDFGAIGHCPTVLLAHGWNGWAQQMEPFVASLTGRGFAVRAFDHIGHGASDGDASSLPVMTRTTARLLAETPHVVGAVGHSLGAAAIASVLASTRRELSGAVLIAPPADPRPYLKAMARMLGAPEALLPRVQAAAEEIAGAAFDRLVMRSWLARQIRTPLLIAHDVDDREVPIAHGYAYTSGAHTRLIATDGLGHTRILRDRHIVDSGVEFVTRERTRAVALAA